MVPCRTERPLLQEFASSHPRVPILFIDERDDPSVARSFLASLSVPAAQEAQVLLDPDGHVAQSYGVEVLPVTFFLTTDGSIEGRHIGAVERDVLTRYLAQLARR